MNFLMNCYIRITDMLEGPGEKQLRSDKCGLRQNQETR